MTHALCKAGRHHLGLGKVRDTTLSRRTTTGHLFNTPFYLSGSVMDAVCRLTDVQVTPKATSPPADADGRNQEAERQRKEWREGLKAHIQQQRAGAQQVRDWLACCWGCREGCRAGQSR